jgi:hypothetical protein
MEVGEIALDFEDEGLCDQGEEKGYSQRQRSQKCRRALL